MQEYLRDPTIIMHIILVCFLIALTFFAFINSRKISAKANKIEFHTLYAELYEIEERIKDAPAHIKFELKDQANLLRANIRYAKGGGEAILKAKPALITEPGSVNDSDNVVTGNFKKRA